MAKTVDVFGFDELKKAFERCEKRYPDYADALLMAQGQAVNKRTKSLTPVRTKKLRNSWRLKKVKLYKGGKVRIVRIQSAAPHAHLIELGHEIVTGGKTRERGRTLNRVQRSVVALNRADAQRASSCLKSLCPRQGQDLTLTQIKCLTGSQRIYKFKKGHIKV